MWLPSDITKLKSNFLIREGMRRRRSSGMQSWAQLSQTTPFFNDMDKRMNVCCHVFLFWDCVRYSTSFYLDGFMFFHSSHESIIHRGQINLARTQVHLDKKKLGRREGATMLKKGKLNVLNSTILHVWLLISSTLMWISHRVCTPVLRQTFLQHDNGPMHVSHLPWKVPYHFVLITITWYNGVSVC